MAIPLDAAGATAIPATAVSSAPSATLSSGNLEDVETAVSTITSSDTSTSTETSSFGAKRTVDLHERDEEQPLAASETAFPTGNDSNPLLYDLGPYSCTHTLDLSVLINVIYEYFHETANTLQARLVYLVFNIHSSADAGSPEKSSQLPADQLPDSDQLIGTLLDATLGTYIYSPSQLQEERSNLNMSWYSPPETYHPIAEYFQTNQDSDGIHSTSDGWPCGKYVEIRKAKRLLLGWGTVDPEMKGYDFEDDENFLFSRNSLTSPVDVEATNDGEVESGCLFNSDSAEVSDIKSSWAQSAKITGFQDSTAPGTDLHSLSNLSKNLKFCGISPMVNQTLLNATADEDIGPYRDISHSVWFWGAEEPYAPSDTDEAGRSNQYRCALMDPTLSGNWRTSDCSEPHYAACRVSNSPYIWALSPNKTSFATAADICPENSSFDVPRTGLEQSYLSALLIESDTTLDLSSGDANSSGIWVNFNSIDVQSCWVTGGVNASCPYYEDKDADERRTIVVPTVAAIIVLIITALTLFVKCNANRRNSRRKKRVIEGWEYEGVPS